MTEIHCASARTPDGHSRLRSLLGAVVCAAVGAAIALPVAAGEPPPQGYGEAKFRMSLAEVQKLYPRAVVVRAPEEARQASSKLPQIDELVLSGETVHGLTDCQVRLRFAADKLWFANVHCSGDQPVREKLIEVYGEPEQVGGHDYWLTEKYGVSLNRTAKVFGFMDVKLDRLIQSATIQAVTQAAQTR